jgi:hypothetical protein
MKNLLITLFMATYALTAQADLKSNFAVINKTYKGPFELNYLQGARNRVSIKQGGSPSGGVQFQAAYRNDTARAMIAQDNFYLGNLFTTNYYELMGEYVFGDAQSSHELDHRGLVAAGSKAIVKAAAMVRGWVMEMQYVAQFPQSPLAKAYTYRGISDSANEQEYANYFFSFYVTAINDEYQYLPAFLLVNKSPIVESASLGQARDLIAGAYDYYSQTYGTDNAAIAALYTLRNAIHNQLTKDVINQLDKFLATYPDFRADNAFAQIRQILVEYYGINASKIAAQAKKLGLREISAAADKVMGRSTYVEGLLELSRAAASARTHIASDKIPYEKRGQVLALLANTSKILNKELSSLPSSSAKSPKIIEAIMNTIYVEGFLIKDNWEYFVKEGATTTNPAALLADIVDAATATLAEAFKPAYTQWVSLEPKMQYFMDNTIKGSALNTASVTIEKLKR